MFYNRLTCSSKSSPISFLMRKSNVLPSFVSTFKGQQSRSLSLLGKLGDAKGAQKNEKRLGRGPGSGHGKTSGRGQKGQKARNSIKSWFEGGQTPIYKLFPKRGFKSHIDQPQYLNLSRLQYFIDNKRIDPTKPITMREIFQSGLLSSVKPGGVKIIAGGSFRLRQPINLSASKASRAAIEAIENMGGTFTAQYYTGFGLKVLANPENALRRFARIPLRAKPISRKNIEYYRDPENRGYYQDSVAPQIIPARPKGSRSSTVKQSPLFELLAELESQEATPNAALDGFVSSAVIGGAAYRKKQKSA